MYKVAQPACLQEVIMSWDILWLMMCVQPPLIQPDTTGQILISPLY